MHPARSNPLRSSEKIAALGQGTWHFAESLARWAQEVASSRLGVDYIDLHVLHWRGRVPLVETIDGFDELDSVQIAGNRQHRNGVQIMR